jgi:molecular chaperone GrpE (heat shock protein)
MQKTEQNFHEIFTQMQMWLAAEFPELEYVAEKGKRFDEKTARILTTMRIAKGKVNMIVHVFRPGIRIKKTGVLLRRSDVVVSA